jgi:hypothetical protein
METWKGKEGALAIFQFRLLEEAYLFARAIQQPG